MSIGIAVCIAGVGCAFGCGIIGYILRHELGSTRMRRRGQVFRYMTQNWPSSGWEEVFTASNAATGGPSTAAAVASGIQSSPES